MKKRTAWVLALAALAGLAIPAVIILKKKK